MTGRFYESDVEAAALSYSEELGYEVLHGPDIAPGEPAAERADYGEVLLTGRLRDAIRRINEGIDPVTVDEAVRKVAEVCFRSPNILENNEALHTLLLEGVPVEVRTEDGRIAGDTVRLVDFARPDNNDWLAVNQLTVLENLSQRRAGAVANERRPDIVVFVNGMPLGLLELKNAADPNATLKKAWNQLQTYKQDMPNLCSYNEVMVISDGLEARAGTLSSDWGRFMPWRTVTGETLAPKGSPELETLVKGVFDKRRLLDLIEYFITFETDGATVRIYYEARLAKLGLQAEERPRIYEEFEEVTEGEEVEGKERLKSKWARLEAMVGTPSRVARIARDIVGHFERRLEVLAEKISPGFSPPNRAELRRLLIKTRLA